MAGKRETTGTGGPRSRERQARRAGKKVITNGRQ
jgi:hypothetical protein